MAINSVNTNTGAMIALQGLNRTNAMLAQVTKRVNTGYKVNDALDDGASFAVAQGLRSDIKAIEAVTAQLSGMNGLLSVANSAATSISDAMARMQSVLVKLSDASVTGSTRSQYETEFNNIKDEIGTYIENAAFNGTNILNTTTSVSVISNLAGTSIDVAAYDLDNDVLTTLGAVPTNATDAKTLLTGSYQTAFQNVGTALGSYGSSSKRIQAQIDYLQSVSNATEEGLGAIVDADMAKESARLQSLQIQQQLATQTLSIANQSPSILLSLFK